MLFRIFRVLATPNVVSVCDFTLVVVVVEECF